MLTSRLNLADRKQSWLIVVIERDNLERMKQADPITLASVQDGGRIMRGIDYPENLSVVIAYEEDDVALYQLAKNSDLLGLLHYVTRGQKFDPKTDGKANLVEWDPAERKA